MELYFAYGSNLDAEQVTSRCGNSGHVRQVSIGYLPNHKLAFTQYYKDWGGGVADVVKSPNDSVWGILYELSRECLELLDKYEGYPNDYTRTKQTIIALDRRAHPAWVYSVLRKDGDFIAPSQKYIDIIKRTAEESGFPKDYLSYLNSIKTVGP